MNLKQKKNEAKGKMIFFNNSIDPTNINTFNSYSNRVIYRFYGAVEAAEYGATGVLIKSLTTKI